MFKLRAFLAGGMSIFSSLVSGQIQTFSGSNGAITDNNTSVYFTAPVSGIGTLSSSQSLISTCIEISHGDLSDLQIYLISPNGTSQRLSNRDLVGTSATNLCFENGAADISTGSSPYSGSFNPDQTLSDFNNGQNADGNWRLRVRDRSSGDNGSVISWSVNFGKPTPNEQDCAGAIPVCQDIYSNPNSYVGTGAIPGEINAGPSCLNEGEKNDVWYVFRAQTGGQLNFNIIPNDGSDDYDWAVYDLSNNNCEDIYTNASLEVGCDYSGSTSNGGRTGANGGNNSQDEPTITVAQGNTYVLNVSNYSSTQNGYDLNFSASTAQIYDNEPPVITSIDNSLGCGVNEIEFTFSENIKCSTVELADFTLTGPGGSYSLSNLISEGCDNGAPFENSFKVSVSPALTIGGDYSLNLVNTAGSVSDNCGNVALPAGFSFTMAGINTSSSTTETTCPGAANGGVVVNGSTGTAPYSYLWDAQAGNSTSNSISGLSAGNYSVTVTDAIGCSAIETLTVNNGVNPIVSSFTRTGNTCLDVHSISFNNTGSSNPSYTYNWTIGNGSSSTAENFTYSNYTNDGDYDVELVISDGQCSDTSIQTITIHALPQIENTNSNVTCNGGTNGSISITHTSGISPYTYAWSNGAVTSSISNLSVGSYSVDVVDANGCVAQLNTTIDQPDAMVLTLSKTDPLCFGGNNGSISTSTIGGTAPYSFNWGTGETSNALSGLTANSYTLDVTDAEGCLVSESITLIDPTQISTNLTIQNVSCNGGNNGEILTNTVGGATPYTFVWNSGETSQNIDNITSGSYSVLVTDINNCSRSFNATVDQPSSISIGLTATEASCFGGSNGAVSSTVSGGTNGYSYLWSTGNTTDEINGLTSGIYSVNVTDALGCKATDSIEVIEPISLSGSLSTASTSCVGGTDGAITSTVSGGTTPYTYTWNTGENSNSISGGANNYTLTVTDANGCSINLSDSIKEPSSMRSNITIDSIDCFNGNNGSISVSTNGGVAPYHYSWNTGSTSNNLTNLSVGNYNLEITDANGCSINETVVLNNPTQISLTTSIVDVNCYGTNNGEISSLITGGDSPYTYAWNTSDNTSTINGLSAGVYSVVVTDSKNCSENFSATVGQPDSLNIMNSITSVSCKNGINGGINSVVSGGTTPYSYSWSNGLTTNIITNLEANDYSLIVTDANGCTKHTTTTVTEPTALNANTVSTATLCSGSNNGNLSITSSGGIAPYTYMWNTGETGNAITGIAGSYSVAITDANGCSLTVNDSILEPSSLALAATIDSIDCYNGSNGQISVSTNGGVAPYAYAWNTGSSTNSIGGLDFGVYEVTVEDVNGCSSNESFTLLNPSQIENVFSNTSVSCFNGNNGGISTITTGGTSPYTYLWNNGVVTQNIQDLTAGNYSLTITDSKGCSRNFNTNITEPDSLYTVSATTSVSCFSGADGAISTTITGGIAPYSYAWNSGETTANISNKIPGSYSLIVEDANGCEKSVQSTINQPTQLSGHLNSNSTLCSGSDDGSLTAVVNGGTAPYMYNWNTGSNSISITEDFGVYTVIVTDGNGCLFNLSDSIQEPEAIQITTSIDSINCKNGTDGGITALISGGTTPYTYNWNTGATTNLISGLTAGTYTIQVTDANGCISTQNIDITEPDQLAASTSIIDAKCMGSSDGEITVSSTGGIAPYTYIWNTGATSSTINGLVEGTYDVQVTDAKGCTTTIQSNVNQPTSINLIAVTTPALCFGTDEGSITTTVSGATGPYTYTWNTGATSQNITGLAAGLYDIIIKDANLCTHSKTIQVSQPDSLIITTNSSPTSCFGGNNGSITTAVSGGISPYTYSWNTGTNSATINNAKGEYTVLITDQNGCTIHKVDSILEPSLLSVQLTPTVISCFGGNNGAINTDVTGGLAPYSYLWNTGENTANIYDKTIGNFSVTVTDANGCTSTNSIELSQPENLSVDFTTKNLTCFENNSGRASITVSGGNSPYTTIWNTGSDSSEITDLSAGSYTVSITDSNGCKGSFITSITEPGELELGLMNLKNVSCFEGSNGSINIDMAGGTIPYNYAWSTGESTNSIQNLIKGTYSLQVMDANGCSIRDSFSVTEPNNIYASFSVIDPNCFQGNDGTIQTSATGGNGGYNYNWNTSAITQNITGLSKGIYSLEITDSLMCTNSFTVDVNEPQEIQIQTTANSANCFKPNGSVTANYSGGTGNVLYHWSNGATTNDIVNVNAGVYTITVVDENGCSNTDTAKVLEIGTPSFKTVNIQNVLCENGKTGAIQIDIDGGEGAYSYSWNTGSSINSISNIAAGVYSVTVEDGNQCVIDSTFIIQEPNELTISGTTVQSPSCYLGNDGFIDLTIEGGTAGYNYSWSNGSSTKENDSLSSGTYFITVTDANECTVNKEVYVPQPDQITVNFNINQPLCFGIETGSANAIAKGGNGNYNYVWSDGTIGDQISNLDQGSYQVNVTDINNCIGTGSVNIIYPENLELTTITEAATCLQANGMAEAVVLGGTGAYEYKWNGSIGGSTNINLSEGVHEIVVKDENGCIETDTIIITDNGLPILDSAIVKDANCKQNDGAIELLISGGQSPYSYEWLNYSSITNSLTNLYSNIYNVKVKDQNNCLLSTQILVNDVDGVQADIFNYQSPLFHNAKNGFAEVEALGGETPYSFQWNDSLNQNSVIASNLKAGVYEVEVTDANNCKDTAQISLINPLPIVLGFDSIQHVNCFNGNDGEIQLEVENGVGPYSFYWSNGDTTQNINNLTAGSYHVMVYDAVGGRSEMTFIINQPQSIAVTEKLTNVTCHYGATGSAELTVNGGSNNYSIVWDNGITSTINDQLIAGTYRYSIEDSKNCEVNGEVIIDEPSLITIDFAIENAHCDQFDGSLIANANGGIPGYVYQWTNGPSAAYYDSLHGGSYTVTATDSKGCSVTDSIIVEDLKAGIVSGLISDSVACHGGTNAVVELNTTGGFGNFQYSINNGPFQLNPIFHNIGAGTHLITSLDGEGCIVNDSIHLGQPEKIEIKITSVLDTTICYGNSIQLSADIEGGTGSYLIDWSGEAVGNDVLVSPIESTVYVLSVKDSNNCTINGGRVKVNVLEPLTLHTSVSPAIICPGDFATMKVTPQGGTGNYTIVWEDSSTNDSIRIVNPRYLTNYEVSVTDGCTNPNPSAIIPVDVHLTPRMNITSDVNEGCEGIVIDLNHVVIPEPYEVEWEINGPDTSVTGSTEDIESFEYGTAGSYDIAMNIITEDGCKDSVTFEDYIQIYPVPHAEFVNGTDDPTYVNSTVQFFDKSQTPFGQIESWEWEVENDDHFIVSNETNPIIEFPDSGSYTTTLAVTNDYGCTDTAQLDVRVDDSYFFYIPNAFTPQSDGLNETYGPVTRGIEYGSYEFVIYNRWGEVVFQSNSPDFWWDGKHTNGNDVQTDAYVWIATFRKSTDKKQLVLNGTVSVIR